MSVRRAAVGVLVALLLTTSCGAEPADAPVRGVPTTSAAVLPQEDIGQTHRTALALIALGELGAEKGSTQALRSLATRTAGDGRALDDQIRELATAGSLVLGDDTDAATQDLLADLHGRSGRDFDQAWLRAVTVVVGQGREAADGLRSGQGEARSVGINVLSRLAALSNALRNAGTRAAAPTR